MNEPPGLPPHPVYRTCDHEYQIETATGGPQCACGLFAIGSCAQCGEHCCGYHGALRAGRFLCSRDWHQIDAVERAAQDERRQELQRAQQQVALEEAHAAPRVRSLARELVRQGYPGSETVTYTRQVLRVGFVDWFGYKSVAVTSSPFWSVGTFWWKWVDCDGIRRAGMLATVVTPAGAITPKSLMTPTGRFRDTDWTLEGHNAEICTALERFLRPD